MNVCSYTPIRNIADVKGINERFSLLFKNVCYLIASGGGGTLQQAFDASIANSEAPVLSGRYEFSVNSYSDNDNNRAFLSLSPVNNEAASLLYIDVEQNLDAAVEVKAGFIQCTAYGGSSISGFFIFNSLQSYFTNSTYTYLFGINVDNPTAALDILGNVKVNAGTINLPGYAVATLPSGVLGDLAYVTDALNPTFGSILVGGGSVVTLAFFDGTNWTAR